MAEHPTITFSLFVLSLAASAEIHLGSLPQPGTDKPGQPNLTEASHLIEVIAMLKDKTEGNLDEQEERLHRERALRPPDALRRGGRRSRARGDRAKGGRVLSRAAARVTFLGTGTSHGVPMIGCRCAMCTSSDPRDNAVAAVGRRSRSTAVRRCSSTRRPTCATQALRFGLSRVDAVLFTHPHADHLLGLDDIRRYNTLQRARHPVLRRPGHDRARCAACSPTRSTPPQHGGGVPQLRLFPLLGPCSFGPMTVTPVPVLHGRLPIYGYRVGSFAYVTDCSAIPDESWALLDGVRTLAVDALRDRPHPTHFTVAQALEVVARLRPERALLTHICHDLGHAETAARLPRGCRAGI